MGYYQCKHGTSNCGLCPKDDYESLRARVAELEAEAGKWRVLHKAVSVALEAAHNREARSARLEAQEASESSFAGWQRRLKFSSNGEVHPWEQCSAHEATDHFDRSHRHEYRQIFTIPQPTPNVKAAVAAVLRKAAEACQIVMQAKFEGGTAYDALEAILEIPHDDSALREICLSVAIEVFNECVIDGKSSSELNNIVYKALNKL